MTSTLTITNRTFSNPITEFLKDFERGFFNFNDIFDLDKVVGDMLKPTTIDRTGFPRANVRNVSTFDDDRLEIVLALPGWNTKNSKIDLTITDSILEIKGKWKEAPTLEDRSGYPSCYGKEYERNISLKSDFIWKHCVPENAEFESTILEDGLLNVIVKVPNKKPQPRTTSLGK